MAEAESAHRVVSPAYVSERFPCVGMFGVIAQSHPTMHALGFLGLSRSNFPFSF
jgi:hypothetical protein